MELVDQGKGPVVPRWKKIKSSIQTFGSLDDKITRTSRTRLTIRLNNPKSPTAWVSPQNRGPYQRTLFMEQNGTQRRFLSEVVQGLSGKRPEKAASPVDLFSIFYHLFTNALAFGTGGKKTQQEQQKNNRAYTDIAPVKEEDQVSLSLCCK